MSECTTHSVEEIGTIKRLSALIAKGAASKRNKKKIDNIQGRADEPQRQALLVAGESGNSAHTGIPSAHTDCGGIRRKAEVLETPAQRLINEMITTVSAICNVTTGDSLETDSTASPRGLRDVHAYIMITHYQQYVIKYLIYENTASEVVAEMSRVNI